MNEVLLCKDCGKPEGQWSWLVFNVGEPARHICGCRLDFQNASLFPWGMSSYLDEGMHAIVDTLSDTAKE